MSGWTDVNLQDISTSITPVAVGEYTFEVTAGAKFSDFDPNRVEAVATITEGDFAGRRLFFSYPDPAKQDWSPRVFKRLVESLGMDIEAGENPVQYLGRATGLRFKSEVKHRPNEDKSAPVKVDLDIFKIRPAA